MATEIVAVDTELVSRPGSANKHDHISKVLTADGRVLSRATVISRIGSGDEEFYTAADGEKPRVVVVDCPSCGAEDDYIRTTADDDIADNLLRLPTIEGYERDHGSESAKPAPP
jgi:hypothetical protein